MDSYTLLVSLLIIITLVTTVALYLIDSNEHKYSGVLFNLNIVGCTHFVFSILYLLRTSLIKPDKDMNRISSHGDLVTFSTICFSTSVLIVHGDVIFARQLAKTCYGIFFFISLCLICGKEKMLGRCIRFDENLDNLELKAPVQPSEHGDLNWKLVDKVVYCYNLIDHVPASISLEYALIYVPVSVLFYITLRQTSTFREWFSKPCMEKCKACQFNMSLCNHTAISFLIVIWFIRPIFLLIVKFSGLFHEFSSDHDDIVPMVSLHAMFFIVLINVIKVYGFRERDSKTQCLNNNEMNNILLE